MTSAADRQRQSRKRKTEKNLVRVEVWVPSDKARLIRFAAAHVNGKD